MGMKGLGVLFIAGAIFIAVAFLLDQFVGRSGRFNPEPSTPNVDLAGWGFESPSPEEEPPIEVDPDPMRVEDFLSREERVLARRRADYRYTVKKDDVLDDLARKYLGDERFKRLLFEANPQLVPGEKLRDGIEIIIPFRYRDD